MQEHRYPVTVYLEDTDAQGIVYHANYLKYCERARTELLKLNGYSLGEMQNKGVLFVVFEMHLRFQKPARLHDELEIRTHATRSSDYRLTFKQDVFRFGLEKPVFVAESTVVTIDQQNQLCPLPGDLLVDG
jgi:tol-pal system-associated acyl-CoA thioesterase